jgi:hypothetical protein
MKHSQLRNHIQGSFLKEEYLEAFLVQSAYIESLLKVHVDFSCWKAAGGIKIDENPVSLAMYKATREYNLYQIIDFLYSAKLISEDLRTTLDSYRLNRNIILHDLIKEIIRKEDFEKELKNICETGNEIIGEEEFTKIIKLIDLMEKNREEEKNKQLESTVPEKKSPTDTNIPKIDNPSSDRNAATGEIKIP